MPSSADERDPRQRRRWQGEPCTADEESVRRGDFERKQVQEFDKTDLYLTMMSTNPKSKVRPKSSLCSFLAGREDGSLFYKKHIGLTSGSKINLYNHFLPRKRRVMASFHEKVFCGTHSRCGELFVTASQDQKIRIYDISSGHFKLFKEIEALNVGWSVLDTALSPDNRHIIYSSWIDAIYLADVYSDENSSQLELPLYPDMARFCVFSLRFNQDGSEILSGANCGMIHLYDRGSDRQSLQVLAHEDDVNTVCFLDDSSHIFISGGDDGMTYIWDRRCLREESPSPVGTFVGHYDGIVFIDSKNDGRHFLSSSKDQAIKLWDIRKFSDQNDARLAKSRVYGTRFDYREHNCPKELLPHFDQNCQPMNGDTSIMTYRGHEIVQTLIRARFSPQHSTGQRFIYSGSADGSVFIYDIMTGKKVQELKGHEDCVRDVSWHPYRSEIVTSSWDHTVAKWTYSDVSDQQEFFKEIDRSKGRPMRRTRLRGYSREDDII